VARRALKDPRLSALDWRDAHRLIPSRYSESGTLLSALADSDEDLEKLVLLDGATNDRVQSEERGSIGISVFELVYGIPNGHVVNAAFTHPNESGSRFNDHTRGAWYAADSQEASIAEVVYHKSRRLSEIIVPEARYRRPSQDTSTFDDWLADFHAEFHLLEPAEEFSECLKPEPVPECYAASQALARRLLESGSNGVEYPSVRYAGAKCIACFRPALVYNPHRSARLEITFQATDAGYDYIVRQVMEPGD
jgi:hypothetical protein